MKAVLLFFFCALMLCPCPQARASAPLDLAGKEFDVFILCTEELGNFCEENMIKKDRFIFDAGEFSIQYFESGTGGLSDSGDYSLAGPTFAADYKATKDAGSYEITLVGFALKDAFVAGIMDIAFTTYEIVLGKDRTEGKALFLGFKN
jgi:hypothetical protein